jgi:hypothetical protein
MDNEPNLYEIALWCGIGGVMAAFLILAIRRLVRPRDPSDPIQRGGFGGYFGGGQGG